MSNFSSLKKCVYEPMENGRYAVAYWKGRGYSKDFDAENVIARANATAEIFRSCGKFVYEDDMIAGSLRGAYLPDSQLLAGEIRRGEDICRSFGDTGFWTNRDHFAPSWKRILEGGIGGILSDISYAMEKYRDDPKRVAFLQSCRIVMEAFSDFVGAYAVSAEERYALCGNEELRLLADSLRNVTLGAPKNFREALQIMWLVYIAFSYEERYAMAIGRMDMYLEPFYAHDVAEGTLTKDYATELVASALIKMGERTALFGGDDVSNIAIGGRRRDGSGGVCELSYVILEAVHRCNIPGPNLSARLYDGIPDEFVDECLKVIGSGLGYPALMNDEVNIPALRRYGYSEEDCIDYCMVGCIENFIQGRQPAWSDGRFNSPKYIELALNGGRCMLTGVQMGPETKSAEEISTMEDFLSVLRRQMEYGAAEYAAKFRNESERYAISKYAQPFLSCFCDDCIARGLDIRDGGAIYPSVHGAVTMGIGTVADSLAAVEKIVFDDGYVNLAELRDALKANFEGCDELRAKLLAAPKYGNDNDYVDKYACMYVVLHRELFDRYRTFDGGYYYIAIASNVQNIPAGREIAATPDGRLSGEPVSDAASPMRGMDRMGPTATMLSVAKPDYTLVACGTVLNQKYPPEMFESKENIARLRSLIKAYFKKGGQEVQINSVSRDVLKDAMEHPENWQSLVVRVSGFSAFYTRLDKNVQKDILMRTEQNL
ncbi:MAG: hypothetical protein IKZ19_09310 [Clostridia bacterium]|nr:hypothetical protein [Clostridia bacterium]